jgi:hypothetical protein
MRKDAAEQYMAYKLMDSNQDWKSKWFNITNHHQELPKPSGKQPKHRPWWNTEPTMQEGIQLPKLLLKIKALREAGLRAEHVAFSFMKRRVQPLMARDTLGYQYTGEGDLSRMPGGEIDDDDITDRLGRIFKDMLAYTPCTVPEYSTAHPPNEVSSRTQCTSTDYVVVVVLHPMCLLQEDIAKFVSEPASPPRLVDIPKEGKGKAKEHHEVGVGDDTVIVENTSDEEDEETLQERFQLRSRFSTLECPMFFLSTILRLVWRLVCLRRPAQLGTQVRRQKVEGH